MKHPTLFTLAPLTTAFLLTLPPPAAAQSPNAELSRRVDKLETGVQRAEALREIKKLQYSFNHYLDAGLWDELAAMMSDNVAGRFPTGELTGRVAIRKYWMDLAGRTAPGLADGQLNTHILLQPIVNLGADGRTAKGTWHEIALLGQYGKSAQWVGGIYENEYAFEEGAWKIRAVRFFEQYRGNYEEPGQKAPADWKVPYHFTGEHVGLTIPVSALEADRPDNKPLPQRLASISTRLRQMEDETAVRNLHNAWGYYLDRKMWDDASDLFAKDGTYEVGQRGVYVGNAQIRKALEAFFGAPKLQYGELFDHINMGTVVSVAPDGRTAYARSTELAMLGLNNVYARWELGTYENTFVKEDGIWKIKALHLYPRMITNYEQGWGKEGLPAAAISADFPPDRKPTVAYSNYPAFSFPAFHYLNPVTGKAPKYPAGVIKGVTMVPGGSLAKPTVPGSFTGMEVMLIESERSLARSIGVDATENLMSSYGYYLDEGLWDDMANTFGREGAKEITGAGVYVGPEKIRAILKLRGAQGVGRNGTSYTIHQLTQPVIHVAEDGKSAKARMRLFQGGGRADGSSAAWIGGTYENTATFENGEWKFGIQDLHHHFNASYKNGWAKFAPRGTAPEKPAAPKPAGAKPAAPAKPTLAQQIPPDRPIRARQYTFPEIDEPAFHYKNPVSGRMPAQLLQ